MTTFNDLTRASMSATSTTSWAYGPNAFLSAVAITATLFTSSVQRSGGDLERDAIMSATSSTAMTAAATVVQAASLSATSVTTMSVAAGDGVVGFLLPLVGQAGDSAYGGVTLPPGLQEGGNGAFEPGEAGSYLHPLTGSASGSLPTPFFAFASTSLAPLVGDGYMLTGQIGSVDEGELSPLHGLSGDYPYGGVTLPPGLQEGGDGSFTPGEAGSYLHPLTGQGYDPGGPVDNGDGTFTYTVEVSELLYTGIPNAPVGTYATTVSETLDVTDDVTPTAVKLVALTEELTITDETTPLATLIVALTEVLTVQSALSRTEYATWVMNARNEANSMYDGFAFDSLVTWRGRTLAAGPDGLFELTGGDDAGSPIVASVLLDKTDFGTSYRKGMEGAYIGGILPDGMQFTLATDDGKTRKYAVKQTPRLATRRVALGKGLLSRYYQGELSNPDGQDFTIDTIELVPVKTQRRR